MIKCNFYHVVFPKVLFWIHQPPNHNFQRLLYNYFMKSKFGSLSKTGPLHSTGLNYSYFPDYSSLYIFVCYLNFIEQNLDTPPVLALQIFKIFLKYHWSFSQLLPSLSFCHTYFYGLHIFCFLKQMISLSWSRNISAFFLSCVTYLLSKDLKQCSLHTDVKDDNVGKIININHYILESSKVLFAKDLPNEKVVCSVLSECLPQKGCGHYTSPAGIHQQDATLVFQVHHNKMPQVQIKQKLIFSQFRTQKFKIKVTLSLLSLANRWLPPCSVLAWCFPCVHVCVLNSSFYKT